MKDAYEPIVDDPDTAVDDGDEQLSESDEILLDIHNGQIVAEKHVLSS